MAAMKIPSNPLIGKLALLAVLAVSGTAIPVFADTETKTIGNGIGPNLAVGPDGHVVLSYIDTADGHHSLVYVTIDDDGVGETRTVASGDNWFVNWADFPSVVPISENLWAAHWLVRQLAGGYAYDAVAAVSLDAGLTWSSPFPLHDDGTPTEHGFVSLYPADKGFAAVWLDGRNMTDGQSDGHDSGQSDSHDSAGGMTLRSGIFDLNGKNVSQTIVDDLTCDCCQTDIATTSDGAIVVYRNRSRDEIRDIYVSREENGVWQPGVAVAADEWNIAGCPVNGPVVNAVNQSVAVTWFTAAETPSVKIAWSSDGGRQFRDPSVLSDAGVIGYVGSTLLDERTLVASWMCKPDGEQTSICYRRVDRDGSTGPLQSLQTDDLMARMSVPQIARLGDELIFVWSERQGGMNRIRMTSRSIASVAIGSQRD